MVDGYQRQRDSSLGDCAVFIPCSYARVWAAQIKNDRVSHATTVESWVNTERTLPACVVSVPLRYEDVWDPGIQNHRQHLPHCTKEREFGKYERQYNRRDCIFALDM